MKQQLLYSAFIFVIFAITLSPYSHATEWCVVMDEMGYWNEFIEYYCCNKADNTDHAIVPSLSQMAITGCSPTCNPPIVTIVAKRVGENKLLNRGLTHYCPWGHQSDKPGKCCPNYSLSNIHIKGTFWLHPTTTLTIIDERIAKVIFAASTNLGTRYFRIIKVKKGDKYLYVGQEVDHREHPDGGQGDNKGAGFPATGFQQWTDVGAHGGEYFRRIKLNDAKADVLLKLPS